MVPGPQPASAVTLLAPLAVLLLASLPCGARTPDRGSRGPGPDRLSRLLGRKPGIPESLGVNIHFTDPKPGEMEQLAAAGFRWVRMDFVWNRIEREKGRYDFSAYDRLLAALDRHKLRALLILDYGNELYQEGAPRSPEAVAAFARFAAAAVTHFAGRGVIWEMYNEPNVDFWRPQPKVDEYIVLAKATGEAIRKAAPNEVYIGPAVSKFAPDFVERCLQAGLLDYWDGISVHPYREPPPETAAEEYEQMRALIRRYAPAGRAAPVLSGEWGYSECYPGMNLELQSRYIAREFLSNLMNGVPLSVWYDWHDDGPDPKNIEHRCGTVTYDYQPKPTYRAVQTLARTLAGMSYSRRLKLGSPDDYCLLFEKGSQVALAAWTTAKDPHEVTIPASPGEFRVVGFTGEETAARAGADGLVVTLDGAPKYLVPKKPNSRLRAAAGR